MTDGGSLASGWRPSGFLRASVGLHAAGAAALFLEPRRWPLVVGGLVLDHALIAAATVQPCSRLLGPNLRRLEGADARAAAARHEVALTFDDGPDPEVTPAVKACDAVAKTSFERAATIVPNYSNLEINRGIVEGELGDPVSAEAHFRRALALNPDANSHFFYARWLVQQRRGPEALSHLNQATHLSPAFADPRALPGDARAGRAARRAGPLPVRPGMGAAAAGGVGADGPGDAGAGRRRRCCWRTASHPSQAFRSNRTSSDRTRW